MRIEGVSENSKAPDWTKNGVRLNSTTAITSLLAFTTGALGIREALTGYVTLATPYEFPLESLPQRWIAMLLWRLHSC